MPTLKDVITLIIFVCVVLTVLSTIYTGEPSVLISGIIFTCFMVVLILVLYTVVKIVKTIIGE